MCRSHGGNRPRERVDAVVLCCRVGIRIALVGSSVGVEESLTDLYAMFTGELRSLKDGRSRRVLPEWVDEYVARKAAECQGLDS